MCGFAHRNWSVQLTGREVKSSSLFKMFSVEFNEHKYQGFKSSESKVVPQPQSKNRFTDSVICLQRLTQWSRLFADFTSSEQMLSFGKAPQLFLWGPPRNNNLGTGGIFHNGWNVPSLLSYLGLWGWPFAWCFSWKKKQFIPKETYIYKSMYREKPNKITSLPACYSRRIQNIIVKKVN